MPWINSTVNGSKNIIAWIQAKWPRWTENYFSHQFLHSLRVFSGYISKISRNKKYPNFNRAPVAD